MQASPLDDARLEWRKASRSSGSGSDCFEVAGAEGVVGVRDSKQRDARGRNTSHVFWLSSSEFRSLTEWIKGQGIAD